MKKITAMILLVAILLGTFSSAYAACSWHGESINYTYYSTSWYKLPSSNPGYSAIHLKDNLCRLNCYLCGGLLDIVLVSTQPANHSLPCGSCGAR
jgi:hypothetical protein